jgi:hypothetical protein
MAMGIQADVQAIDTETDVVGLIHGRRDAQECAVERLGVCEILDGVDERLDAVGHGVLLRLRVTSTGLATSLL